MQKKSTNSGISAADKMPTARCFSAIINNEPCKVVFTIISWDWSLSIVLLLFKINYNVILPVGYTQEYLIYLPVFNGL